MALCSMYDTLDSGSSPVGRSHVMIEKIDTVLTLGWGQGACIVVSGKQGK